MSTKKIYTNTIAQLAGKVITAFISIYLINIITNYLGVAGFGLYSKIYNFLSIFAIIADFGLYTISVRELAKFQNNTEKLEKIAGNILSLRTISGIGIIVLSLSIAPFLQGYNSFIALLGIFIVSIFTLFGLINSSLMSSLQASLRAEFGFVSNVAGKILTFGLIFLAVFVFFTQQNTPLEIRFMIVFGAGLLGNILMTLLTWWYAKKWQKIRFYWDKDYIIYLLKISFPYGIALFLGAIFLKVDVIFLSVMEPQDIADKAIALYSLPMKLVEFGMMYGTIFLNSFLPILTQAIEQKNTKEIRKLSHKGFEILMGFGAGISIFLSFFAEEIISLIANPTFAHTTIHGFTAVDTLRIISWIFLFYFISSLSNYILIAKNQQKKIIYLNSGVAIFNIIGNYLAIPYYSFVGSAYVTLLSQIILVVVSIYFIRNEIRAKTLFIISSLLGILSFISGVFVYFIEQNIHGMLLTNNHGIVSKVNLFIELSIAGILFWTIYFAFWYLIRKIYHKKVYLNG